MKQSFVLPAPSTVDANPPDIRVRWDVELAVAPELVAGGGAAIVRVFLLRSYSDRSAGDQRMVLRVSEAASGNPLDAGPDFTPEFEANWRITVGDHQFDSADFAADTAEPYVWIGRAGINISRFRSAIADISTSGAGQVLTLDDSKGVSRGYRLAQRALAPEDVVLTALEITHPDVSAPIRVVNDAVDREIVGETYIGLRFDARLVDDVDGRAPRAELIMDNVGRVLTEWIERASGGAGASVRVMQIVAGQSIPEWELTLELAGVSVSQSQATGTIGYEPLLGRRAVALRHDPETSPGLF